MLRVPVIVASAELAERLRERTGIYRVVATGDPASEIIGRARQGSPIVGVFDGASHDAQRIWGEISAGGHNPALFMPVDPAEEAFSGGLGLEGLVTARATYLASSKAWEAALATNSQGRVVLPRLANEAACAMLRGCNSCVESCPFQALQGKPPRISPERCTGCGVCSGKCPISVLMMPGITFEALEYMIDQISRRVRRGVIAPVCYKSYEETISALNGVSLERPIFLLPVPCVSWFTPIHALQALYRGYAVVSVCNPQEAARCAGEGWSGVLGGLPAVLDPVPPGDLPGVVRDLALHEPLGESTLGVSRPELVHKVAAAYGVSRLDLGAPAIGNVVVDGDRCMLCDACSVMCPYGALKLAVRGDRIQLLFEHHRCTACHVCEYACPYGAIRVKYSYDSSRYGSETVLAEDEVARCRMCGAPIGSMKMLRLLEKTMRERGASELALRQLWLCPRCKIRGLSEEAESP